MHVIKGYAGGLCLDQNVFQCMSVVFFSLQNDLHNERKSKIKYIQQCSNWYIVTKKENVKTIVNKTTKQNNLAKSVIGDEKHY